MKAEPCEDTPGLDRLNNNVFPPVFERHSDLLFFGPSKDVAIFGNQYWPAETRLIFIEKRNREYQDGVPTSYSICPGLESRVVHQSNNKQHWLNTALRGHRHSLYISK